MENANKKDLWVNSIAKYLRDSTREYSDKQMEDMLTVAQHDAAMTRTWAEEEIKSSSRDLHKSYHRALLVFAGICITPLAAALTGSAIPGGIGLGLGAGVVGCMGYAAYYSYEYMQTEKVCCEKVAEREATAAAADILLTERKEQECPQR